MREVLAIQILSRIEKYKSTECNSTTIKSFFNMFRNPHKQSA